MSIEVEAGQPVDASVSVTMTGLELLAATAVQIADIGSDVVLVFTRPATGHALVNGAMQGVAQARPIAEILVSKANFAEIANVIAAVAKDGGVVKKTA